MLPFLLLYSVAVGVVILGNRFAEGVGGGLLDHITVSVVLIGQGFFTCTGAFQLCAGVLIGGTLLLNTLSFIRQK